MNRDRTNVYRLNEKLPNRCLTHLFLPILNQRAIAFDASSRNIKHDRTLNNP